MNELNPEEVILRLESELDQYVNAKAHLPRLCADACEIIRMLIAEKEIVLEANKELTGLLSKKNKCRDAAIQRTMYSLKKKSKAK